MDRILNDIYMWWKDGRRFHQKRVRNPDWEQRRRQKILHVQRAFLYNLYEHDVKFPFATLFGGRKHTETNSVSSLSPNLGAVPKTP